MTLTLLLFPKMNVLSSVSKPVLLPRGETDRFLTRNEGLNAIIPLHMTNTLTTFTAEKVQLIFGIRVNLLNYLVEIKKEIRSFKALLTFSRWAIGEKTL